MSGYVVVFGNCSWDLTFKQREDLSYSDVADFGFPGGKGANQAVAMARAGYNVKMISVVGNDDVGKYIIQNLKDNNVDVSGVLVSKKLKSDRTKVFVSINGDNTMERTRQAVDEINDNLIFNNAEVIKNADFVVTVGKLKKEVIKTLIDFCFSNKVKTVLTPCPVNGFEISNVQMKDMLQKVTYIIANEEETKYIVKEETLEDCINKMPNFITTASGNGVFFKDQDGKIVNVSAQQPKEIKDTTGAGDTFCGNFVVALLNGLSKVDAIKRGIWASTIKLESFGAQPGMPTKDELDKRINQYKVKIYF